MNRKKNRILFYPQRPSKHSTIYKIAKVLDYEIINNPQEQYDLAVSWEDITFRDISMFLPKANGKIVNERCNDISKKKIDKIFKSVFNYSTFIDPAIFNGKCVKKSNLNAKHDGQIVECPIELQEPGVIYQKLINNENENWGIYDIRTPVFNQTIPFVLIKSKIRERRFEDYFTQSFIQETNTVFNSKEVADIIKFCKRLGFDYGELDILRDSTNNKIYIIDANNTPWWCPFLPPTESDKAIDKLAETFKKEFCA